MLGTWVKVSSSRAVSEVNVHELHTPINQWLIMRILPVSNGRERSFCCYRVEQGKNPKTNLCNSTFMGADICTHKLKQMVRLC